MIRITANKEGFRRCGIAHSKQATEHPDGTFDKTQLAILQLEPNLVVEIIEETKTPSGPNAKESIQLVQTAATLEDLDQLADGEERKTVVDAIEKRRAELTEGSEE